MAKRLFTKKEVYNNQFLTSEIVTEKRRMAIDGFKKLHTVKRLVGHYRKVTRAEAETLSFRDLCLLTASRSLQFRDINGAIDNATHWYQNHTREELLDTMFSNF